MNCKMFLVALCETFAQGNKVFVALNESSVAINETFAGSRKSIKKTCTQTVAGRQSFEAGNGSKNELIVN